MGRRTQKGDAHQGWSPVEEKLIRLALNEAAAPGEVENCAVKLFTLLRKRKVTPEQLIQTRGELVPTPPSEYAVYYGDIRLPFGKHRGSPISEVDPDYLTWFANNCQSRASRTCAAIARFLRQAGY